MNNFTRQWASINMAELESTVVNHILRICVENNVVCHQLHDSYVIEGDPDNVKIVCNLLNDLFIKETNHVLA